MRSVSINLKPTTLFFLYSVIYSLVTWLFINLIFTDEYYFSALGNQLNTDRIIELLDNSKKFTWLSYLVTPILVLFKWHLIAAVLYLGIVLHSENISYKACINIVAIAEVVLILSNIFKLIYLYINGFQTYKEVDSFAPMSLLYFFPRNQIPSYLIYPLQQINFFEILYWGVLTAGVRQNIKKTFPVSLSVVASSYGLSILIWILLIVFLQLQFS